MFVFVLAVETGRRLGLYTSTWIEARVGRRMAGAGGVGRVVGVKEGERGRVMGILVGVGVMARFVGVFERDVGTFLGRGGW